MYRRAVEWLEDAGKDALAGDVFRWAAPAESSLITLLEAQLMMAMLLVMLVLAHRPCQPGRHLLLQLARMHTKLSSRR